MPFITVEASRIIPAPAGQVYNLLADYEHGHHQILPKKYFEEMRILSGGKGAGTVVSVLNRPAAG